MRQGVCTVETRVGVIGLAWAEDKLTRLVLPEASLEALEIRLAPFGSPAPPPAWVLDVRRRLAEHAAGHWQDFRDVPLDRAQWTSFRRRVSEELQRVPPGQTVTYGELARRAGSPKAARAVGGAMASNPFPILVPCHRVVGANGLPGGFTAAGGLETKNRLLEIEGVHLFHARQPGDGPLFEGEGLK